MSSGLSLAMYHRHNRCLDMRKVSASTIVLHIITKLYVLYGLVSNRRDSVEIHNCIDDLLGLLLLLRARYRKPTS